MWVFEGDTADAAWLSAAKAFAEGEAASQPSRAGPTVELLRAAFILHNPRERWVSSRSPAMNPAFALAEVVWILTGNDDATFLNFWNPALPNYAGTGPRYQGAYGERLRRHFGIDQLDRAAKALLSNPDTRQVVLQIWDPASDLPREDGTPSHPDIPCNVVSMLKLRNGKLEWTQVLRSNDLFLGVPHNFVQFTVLQELVAGWLEVEMGTYVHVSDSLHVYEKDLAHVGSALKISAPSNPDSIALSRKQSEEVLRELGSCSRQMTQPDLTERELERLIAGFRAPVGFRNWLQVLAAESARRRGWHSQAAGIMEACASDLLRLLWERWRDRIQASGGTPDLSRSSEF